MSDGAHQGVTPEFKALEWSETKGRGRVAAVAWDRTAGEARALLGESVTIDGTRYTVAGVETHAIPDRVREKVVGLLVAP